MDMTLGAVLIDLGLNIGANFIYDQVRSYFSSTPNPSIAGLSKFLESSLNIDGAAIKAHKIIEVLAQTGFISIQNTSLHSQKSISYTSIAGSAFQLRDNVVSTTASGSSVSVGQDASIIGQGGGQLIQDEDGNIIIKA